VELKIYREVKNLRNYCVVWLTTNLKSTPALGTAKGNFAGVWDEGDAIPTEGQQLYTDHDDHKHSAVDL
jgi:hypothetical protein